MLNYPSPQPTYLFTILKGEIEMAIESQSRHIIAGIQNTKCCLVHFDAHESGQVGKGHIGPAVLQGCIHHTRGRG